MTSPGTLVLTWVHGPDYSDFGDPGPMSSPTSRSRSEVQVPCLYPMSISHPRSRTRSEGPGSSSEIVGPVQDSEQIHVQVQILTSGIRSMFRVQVQFLVQGHVQVHSQGWLDFLCGFGLIFPTPASVSYSINQAVELDLFQL